MALKRRCAHCGDVLQYRGGRPAEFCQKTRCQNERKKRSAQRLRPRRPAPDVSPKDETIRNLTKAETQVVHGLRSGLHASDAARGWMVPAAVTGAMACFEDWLSERQVVPADVPDDLVPAIRFGMACSQAIHAWHVETGRIIQASPAAVKDIWLQRLAPPELPADPQAAAAARVGRAKRLVSESEAQPAPDIAIADTG